MGSSQVGAMKDWYRACFGPDETEMGAFVFGGVQIAEHAATLDGGLR